MSFLGENVNGWAHFLYDANLPTRNETIRAVATSLEVEAPKKN